MPWFKVDDSAHSHPKLRRAGNAALGLWMLGGSYAAQYLTDGVVHGHFANGAGTAPQVAKLVKAGLWHPAGHDCPRCPQPTPGDFVIHDYLVYNPSRTRVLAERDRAAEKKRKQREGAPPSGKPPRSGPESNANRDRIESDSQGESSPIHSPVFDGIADQEAVSPGDSRHPRARAARPAPAVPPYVGTAASWASRDTGIPDALQPLAKALAAAGLGAVAWDIRKFTDWERIRIQLDRLGPDVMVRSAYNAANRRGEPDSVTAWIERWEKLPDPQPLEAPERTVVPMLSTNDQRAAQGQVLAAMYRAQEQLAIEPARPDTQEPA